MGQAPSDGGHASSAYGILMAVSNGASSPSLISDEGFHPFFDGFLNPVIADTGAPPIGGHFDCHKKVFGGWGLERAFRPSGLPTAGRGKPPRQRGMGGGGQPRQSPINLHAEGSSPRRLSLAHGEGR